MNDEKKDEASGSDSTIGIPGGREVTESDIFAVASEIENPDEREKYLDAACGGNVDSRKRVENLLQLDVDMDFLIPGDTHERAQEEAVVELGELATKSADKHETSLETGDFIIGREIARGGMGSIREAEEIDLQRHVAIKVMHWDAAASPEVRARFVREAKVLAQLAHPNIVPIYDIAWKGDVPIFYSMKLVKGETLQAILNRLREADAETVSAFPLERLLDVFRKICDPIAFAHSRGILHRDLKPENIMVGEFGEVLVMDWGIAKRLGERDDTAARVSPGETFLLGATLQGDVMGTPQYMSPEQARGEIDQLDERSDVFSLGAILYAILTLRPPVEGDSVEEVLDKITRAEIDPPTSTGTGTAKGESRSGRPIPAAKDWKPLPHISTGRVPAAVSSVAMKALGLDKKDRYSDAESFGQDIEKFQSGYATIAENAGFGKQLALLIQRNRTVFTSIATAALIITALVVLFVINLSAKEKRAVVGEEAARRAEAIALEKEAEARQALAKSATSLAEASLREGNGRAMRSALEEVPESLRDADWNYLWQEADMSMTDIGTSVDQTGSDSENISDVAPHPVLPDVFVYGDRNSRIGVINVRSGEKLMEFATGIPGYRGVELALSPDGERIAVGSRFSEGGRIVIHSGRNGGKLLEWESNGSEFLQFSPDGLELLQIPRDYDGFDIRIWDVASGSLSRTFRRSFKPKRCVFSRDGTRILVNVLANAAPEWIDSRSGESIDRLGTRKCDLIAISPDGSFVVTADYSGVVHGINMEDGFVEYKFRTDDRRMSHIEFTGDGERFVTLAELSDGRQAVRVWDAELGLAVQNLLGGEGAISGLAVHPLSGEAVVSGVGMQVWDLSSYRWAIVGKAWQNVSTAFWRNSELVFGPSGPHGTVELLNMRRNPPESLWSPPPGAYRSATVSADGSVAAIGLWATKHPLLILGKNGSEVEQIAEVKCDSSLRGFKLSPTGKRLAVISGDYRRIVINEVPSGERLEVQDDELWKIQSISWVSDDVLAFSSTLKGTEEGAGFRAKRIAMVSAVTGETLHAVDRRYPVNVIAVSPDNQLLAVAGSDKMVRLHDLDTLEVIAKFRAHNAPITAMAWHREKNILATGSADLSIRLWNTDTGERVETLYGPTQAPSELDFSPDGKRFACASIEGVVRIWDLVSQRDAEEISKLAESERNWFLQKPSGEVAPAEVTESRATPQSTATSDDDWVDLIRGIPSELFQKEGNGWWSENGTLHLSEETYSVLSLGEDLSNTDYRIKMQIQRAGTKRIRFHLVLPVGDRMTGFDLDAMGKYSSLAKVDGKMHQDLPEFVNGLQVGDQNKHELTVTVRVESKAEPPLGTVTVELDSKPFYHWSGPVDKLSQANVWIPASRKGSVGIGSNGGGWLIHAARLKRIAE